MLYTWGIGRIAPTRKAVGVPTSDMLVGASGFSGYMAYLYILKSDKDKFYIGSTINLENRLKHHKGGFTPSTKRMGNVDLIFYQEYQTLKEARYVERRLKQLKRRDYIEKIIHDGIIKMKMGA